MAEKACTCKEPKVTQVIPEGFKGMIRCLECQGLAKWPREEKKYKGADPVEEYLFYAGLNGASLTHERAVLQMLLRIEKALLALKEPEKEPKKK